jgi:hypothetical protein
VAAGCATVALATALTVAVLGTGSYRDYVHEVLPRLEVYRGAWNNASLPGLWHKLFAGGTVFGRTAPLWHSPAAAGVAGLLSCLVVAVLAAAAAYRARSRVDSDHAFGVTVTAMLLASPITWDHYFLLLLVPAALFIATVPPWRPRWYALVACLALLWLPPEVYHLCACVPRGAYAQPYHTLTFLAMQTYALLGLFVLGLASVRGRSAADWRAAATAWRPPLFTRPDAGVEGAATPQGQGRRRARRFRVQSGTRGAGLNS